MARKKAPTCPPVSERHKAFLMGAPNDLLAHHLNGDLSFILKAVLDAAPSKLRAELLEVVTEAQATAQVLSDRLEALRSKSA